MDTIETETAFLSPILQSPTVTNLLTALLAAQAEFDPVVKEKVNPAFRSKYADLSAVLDAVTPALRAHKLLLHHSGRVRDGEQIVVTILWHAESGEWVGSEWKLKPVKADPQGEGSALTYLRRYQALALLGIASEDDDGNAASGAQRQQPQRAAARRAEASGRDWIKEAGQLTDTSALRALWDECGGFNELTSEVKSAMTARQAELKRGGRPLQAVQ